MNPIVFALRRPITVMMLVLALGLGGMFSIVRMQKDIFPALNQPQLYVIHNYGGMDPKQIEGLITNVYELFFQYINGVEHVESRSIQSMVMLKLYFQPGIDMAEATAQTVAYCNRALALMPVGSLPPYVVRLDAGSLPVGYLVFESESRSVGELQDMALYRIRTMFSGLPGISSPPPFGGNVRTIVVNVDPDRLRSYNLSPQDIVNAIDRGNFISPSGNVTIKDQMAIVPANTMVGNPQELRNIPLKLGENVYIRDVGTVSDATDIPVGYALVNGKKSVYLPVVKQASASTLTVVDSIKQNMGRFQAALPEDVKISYEFDESPIVYRAIESVGVEGALGAGLTGLMVLLFLRDLRAVIIVVLNIPLALLGSIVILDLTGNTINIMTLGGLALAIGILVDEATVEIENIHTQMEHTPSMSRAVRQGNMETAVPRLLALLCILCVFIPSFIMTGAVRALFVPLSLAVGGAMITSYLLSSTFVPVLSVWLLENRHGTHGHGEGSEGKPGFFVRFQDGFEKVIDWTVAHRRKVVLAYLLATGAVVVMVGSQLGRELFPRVDTGQFQLRVRPPQGTQFELTSKVAQKTLEVIADEAGPKNVDITMGYAGANPPQFTINMAYLWSRGPDDSLLRVGLREGSGVGIFALQERLRKALPEKVGAWYREELSKLGLTPNQVDQRLKDFVFAFEPGDLISQTMSLGSPAPIEVVVSGRNMADSSAFMDKLREQFDTIESLRDVQIQQSLHYPAVQVTLDRQRRAQRRDRPRHRPVADRGHLLQPVHLAELLARRHQRQLVPGPGPGPAATDDRGDRRRAGPADHAVQSPAGGEGRRFPLQPHTSVADPRRRPRDAQRDPRRGRSIQHEAIPQPDGQRRGRGPRPGDRSARRGDRPRRQAAEGHGGRAPRPGRADAGDVPLAGDRPGRRRGRDPDHADRLLPGARLALTAVASVPAVLCGVVLALWITRTTLNIESFMGAIMAVGVAVSNAIMLVSFGDRHRREEGMPADRAAITAAKGRLRPIIMTGCAMVAGMIPMSLGIEEGSEQNAPLGRAVIGGMALATFATLLVLPAVFTLLLGGASNQSPSLDPDDPESTHYDPIHPTHAHEPPSQPEAKGHADASD